MDVVSKSRQRLSKHMKKCKALQMDATKEKPPSSSMKGMSPSSSKKKKKHKKKKSHVDSLPSSQKDSQDDLQMTPQKDSQMSSQTSPHQSIHQSQKESTTAPSQKKHPGGASKYLGKTCLSKTPSMKDKDSKKKHKTHKQK